MLKDILKKMYKYGLMGSDKTAVSRRSRVFLLFLEIASSYIPSEHQKRAMAEMEETLEVLIDAWDNERIS